MNSKETIFFNYRIKGESYVIADHPGKKIPSYKLYIKCQTDKQPEVTVGSRILFTSTKKRHLQMKTFFFFYQIFFN